MRILLIDDHGLFREGVRLLLERAYPECEILEGRSCEEMSSLTSARPVPELAILDLGLPGASGTDGIRIIRDKLPDTRICIVSGDETRATVARAIQAGAHGYIPKSTQFGELLSAIQLVLAGGRHVPSWALDLVSPAPEEDESPRLTKRQLEILERLTRGEPNKVIARELGLATGTVRVHVGAILAALGARNRTEAARIAHEKRLVPR